MSLEFKKNELNCFVCVWGGEFENSITCRPGCDYFLVHASRFAAREKKVQQKDLKNIKKINSSKLLHTLPWDYGKGSPRVRPHHPKLEFVELV